MHSIPVLKSKLTMPELPKDFLLTGRLQELHQEMALKRVVTICAPAGYGKTTLAASFLHGHLISRDRVCWYRLEPDDRNLPVFINHLLETLFSPEENEYGEARRALENAGLRLKAQDAAALICREMWKLHERTSNARRWVVFDDFQNVIEADDIRDTLIFMLDHLPPSCSIFLLSRNPTAVFTEKQKLEKELLEIDKHDLACNENEIRSLIHTITRDIPDEKTVRSIAQSTEGWIAGIIILCKAAAGKGLYAAVESGRTGSEGTLFRYMSMEVLKLIDDTTRDALAKLALLRDFSGDDALTMLGINDVRSLMKQCLEFGMFIETIHGNPAVYRFHPLFRDFLLTVLEDVFTVEETEAWHLAAASCYIETSRYGRAAEHIAQCGSVEKTIELVTGVGIRLMIVGESGQLKAWLDMLPLEVVSGNPVLLVFKALLMPQARHKEAEKALIRAFRLAQAQNNLVMQYRAATSLVYHYFCNNNMAGIVRATESILRQNPESWEPFADITGLLEVMRSIGKGLYHKGRGLSARILYAGLPDEDRWLFLAYSSIIDHCLGRLDDAERSMETALSLDCVKNVEPAKATALYLLSTVLILKHDPDRLLAHLSELYAIGEKYDLAYHLAGANRLAAFERYLAFDTGGAVDLLDNAVSLYNSFDNRAMAVVARLLKLLWAGQPAISAADLTEFREEVELIRQMNAGVMLHEICLSLLGAVAREAGNYSFAENCLLSSIKAARRKKSNQVLCGSCFHIAALYFVNGSPEQGHRYLKQAMELAYHGRFFMFWDIHIPTIVEMILRSIRYGYRSYFGQELLSRFFGENATLYLMVKSKPMPENQIRDFSINFISTYQKGLAGQFYIVQASLFGNPEIAVNGVKIPDSEWKTRKNKGILEYLLLNSGKTVSKETLMDIFWPDADSKSALVSLRTALYRLRKTLARYGAAVAGENAFIFESLNGMQIRKNEALDLDLHHFLKINRDLSMEGISENAAQKELLQTMLSLYRGELGETSDYGEYHFYERERCRVIFEEACLKLSAIYIHDGEPHLAEETLRRVFTADPYNENACYELLKLYISQGMRSKAVKLYNSFKKRVSNDLHLEVDERLSRAFNEL